MHVGSWGRRGITDVCALDVEIRPDFFPLPMMIGVVGVAVAVDLLYVVLDLVFAHGRPGVSVD